MSAQDLSYFKFVQNIIDAGIWAKMSAAARTLYPVLLRFSDRNYAPVYPGSNRLLQLTGFKQKSSLRRAREELITLGLISTTPGNGRSNTVYHFRFDWATPREAASSPPEGCRTAPGEGVAASPGGLRDVPAYNQIHISINNQPESGDRPELTPATGASRNGGTDVWEPVMLRFGQEAVKRARNELELAGLPDNPADVEKILSGSSASAGMSPGESWEKIRDFLKNRISPMSLEQLEHSLLRDAEGILVFRSNLPEHLKHLLGRVAPHVCFEPGMNSLRREIWNQAGNNG